MPKPEAHRKRRENSVKRRLVGAPLYIAAGIHQGLAERVEVQVAGWLNRSGTPGAIWVPRMNYRSWYSKTEAETLFGLAARRIIGASGNQLTSSGEPTPRAIFLLYVDDARQLWITHASPYFEFWAWPIPLQSGEPEGSVHNQAHWSRDISQTVQNLISAIKRVHADDSPWVRIEQSLKNARSPYRLPPVNFRFPLEGLELADTYRRVLRGEQVALPQDTRAPKNSLSFHVVGTTHHRDACGRFFARGRGEDGCLRELPARVDTHRQLVWLNAAFRFGIWMGDDHEHYDVQRGVGRSVSPPEVFCAERRRRVFSTQEYINLFHNDVIRDNSIFAHADPASTSGE